MPHTAQLTFQPDDEELDDEDRQLLAWFEQATTDDPILTTARWMLSIGEPLSTFHWRLIQRAHDRAQLSPVKHSGPKQRQADRVAAQQAAVAERQAAKASPETDPQPITETS